MALQIIRNNIVNVQADAIVNTANPNVDIGSGVDSAIYYAAGWKKLLEARRAIGPMRPGTAAYTPAFDLDAKYIIHTVGPAWRGGGFGERETVAQCYRESLALAAELGCESIAFPLIATGTYGFPKDEALRIAMAEISSFLLGNEMEVLLVVYDKESFEVSGKLFSDIRMFIGDADVDMMSVKESQAYGRSRGMRSLIDRFRSPRSGRTMNAPLQNAPEPVLPSEDAFEPDLQSGYKSSVMDLDDAEYESSVMGFDEEDFDEAVDEDYEALRDVREEILYDAAESAFGGSFSSAPKLSFEEPEKSRFPSVKKPVRERATGAFPSMKKSLEERLLHMDKTFQEYLFMLIDRRGLTDPEVYKKANIDRKHFSKIRSNVDYSPSKKTALALALALELNIDETRDLLRRAGLALSPSIMSDRIIEYCIETGNYDIYEINCILFKYDQPTLGV